MQRDPRFVLRCPRCANGTLSCTAFLIESAERWFCLQCDATGLKVRRASGEFDLVEAPVPASMRGAVVPRSSDATAAGSPL